MVNTYQKFVSYVGAGNLATYTFPFKIKSADEILIMVFDTTLNTLVFSEAGNVLTNVTSVTFDAVNGAGSIVLPANLAVGRKLFIKLGTEAPSQDFQFREQSDFKLRQIEQGLDYCVMMIQRLFEKSSRALSFNDSASYTTGLSTEITTLPVPDGIPMMNATGDGLIMVDAATLVGGSGGGLPAGGTIDQVLGHDGATGVWRDFSFSGFSSRFGSIFTSTSLQDTLSKIIAISYTAPSVSFTASGSGTIREKGASVASTLLTATVTKTSDNIAEVRFYQGATLLDTNTGTIPTGGVETFTYSTPFTDNITFSSQTDDDGTTGGPTTVTSSASFTFVYPYYSDAGAVGLSAAAVGALTKTIIASTATVNKTMTATAGQVLYFAYPAAYPALTSILDVSNFETIADWTVTTANITGLDATAQSYRIYEFNNPLVAGSYYYSFRR